MGFMLVDEQGRQITEADQRGLLLYNGGTVCDDSFTDNAARAICIELGYTSHQSWDSSGSWSIQVPN